MNTRKQNLSAEEVRELFDYDPETGAFTLTDYAKSVGHVFAEYRDQRGTLTTRLGSETYMTHRLIWLWVHGAWPPFDLQHQNRVRDDNRLVNLVERDHSLAQLNRKTPSRRGRSGFLGVSRIGGNPDDRKYVANITVKGKHHFLGSFNDPSEAHQAYLTAKHELLTASPQHRES